MSKAVYSYYGHDWGVRCGTYRLSAPLFVPAAACLPGAACGEGLDLQRVSAQPTYGQIAISTSLTLGNFKAS
eukprot:3419829-Pyramimonas_sp.AAC.2